ncbi:MAG TPA: 1,4-alpha-glucan branching protein GlgB [Patescibacteria group bacterium]|nr:1,4-alpha-glucan branching protein GlgB [Patescibacteria group bacterium]
MSLSADDIYLFNEGRNFRLYNHLGAHVQPQGGVRFAVWAPNAKYVAVVGDFNHWNRGSHKLAPVGSSGIWEGTFQDAGPGQAYKYYIESNHNGYTVEKADPFGFCAETPPKTASVIHDIDYKWNDDAWMKERPARQRHDKPISVYELHLGSWRQRPEDYNRALSYTELADELVAYIQHMGFTHVELMPIMEHPFGGSWGYQVTGYYAPTRRYGDPQELMLLIDRLHQAGIGVLLDWVPSHFPDDQHGLSYFDGTHLFEHADPRQGFHPDWNSLIFNYGRNEVRSFLISNACFWLDKYHIDGLRVDAVASMLYLDYSRKPGEWIPNQHGGRENLEAIRFLRELNTAVYGGFPGVQMIAEESTDYDGVSRPVEANGLGFGFKWDMGWMHDTLKYFSKEPVHRRFHQNDITFRSIYAFHENFMLPLSHDEVVHGKGSLINKMPGDDWQKFANLRLLYSYMYAQPGKKLLFMGGEFAQLKEWNHNTSLDWHLAGFDRHQQIQRVTRDLNLVYKTHEALHLDCDASGFEWIDGGDAAASVLSFLRFSKDRRKAMMCAFNFTPVTRKGYRIGVPFKGHWTEVFNSDDAVYGGSGHRSGDQQAGDTAMHGRPYSVTITLPPLGAAFFEWSA